MIQIKQTCHVEGMKTRVCILTSVHPPFDTRIFHKQAKTLAKAGYEVTLIAQHDKDEVVDGIKIIALPRPKNRFWRMLGTWRVLRLALKQKADIYHFHDPELLPVGMLLKLTTKGRVIYDVHENVIGDILTKDWIPKCIRQTVSWMYQLVEKIGLVFVDTIIIAEDSYAKNYRGYNKLLALRNYPVLALCREPKGTKYPQPTIVYVGGITELRGVLELIESVRLLKPKHETILLMLVGPTQPASLEGKIHSLARQFDIEDNIRLAGRIDHEKVYDILQRCHIGVEVLHPIPNYLESLATKLFEYMAAGLPIIASNFPMWREIVEGNNCGLTVDPLNPEEIARAIEYLLDHPDEARKMGEDGRKAVMEKYNWEAESQKLLDLYADLD